MRRDYFAIGCIMLAIGIAAGAFGAHGLEDAISDRYLDVWKTGWTYWIYNALGILSVISFVQKQDPESPLEQSVYGSKGILKWIIIGSLIFTLSLSVLSLNELTSDKLKIMGAITPIGGTVLILSWLYLAIVLFKHNRSN